MVCQAEDNRDTTPRMLDLSGLACPQNSSRALIELELMDPGEELVLTVDDGEPCEKVPVTLEWEGHEVLSQEKTGDQWTIRVVRGDD